MFSKQRGFNLIELTIVIAIIGVLASLAVPVYSTYQNKARFTEVVQAVAPFKLSVEACMHFQQNLTNCGTPGANIISPNFMAASPLVGYTASVTTTTNGVITATSQRVNGSAPPYTYILVPSFTNQQVTWVVDPASSCLAEGYCSR